MEQSQNTNAESLFRTMLTVWFAILVSVGLLFLITLLVRTEQSQQPQDHSAWLNYVSFALGLLTFAFSFPLKRKWLAHAIERQKVGLVFLGVIIALALCEATSLFGVMAFFVTASPYYYVLFVVSAVGMLLHFPRKSQLLTASHKKF